MFTPHVRAFDEAMTGSARMTLQATLKSDEDIFPWRAVRETLFAIRDEAERMNYHAPFAAQAPFDIVEYTSVTDLAARYEACQKAIAQLGGRFGTEDISEALWEEIQEIVAALASQKARTIHEMRLKLAMALDVAEESDPSRFLFESLADDLAAHRPD